VNGHGNENKGKETTPTCQGELNFFECAFKSLHKALETKMFKTYCRLNFSKTLENVIPH
jgi:hypothetical protein